MAFPGVGQISRSRGFPLAGMGQNPAAHHYVLPSEGAHLTKVVRTAAIHKRQIQETGWLCVELGSPHPKFIC